MSCVFLPHWSSGGFLQRSLEEEGSGNLQEQPRERHDRQPQQTVRPKQGNLTKAYFRSPYLEEQSQA
ncbi:Protein transport protein Sec16B [Manis javanica]|nr:Protein transport protein Sec16B [Manis javanica]